MYLSRARVPTATDATCSNCAGLGIASRTRPPFRGRPGTPLLLTMTRWSEPRPPLPRMARLGPAFCHIWRPGASTVPLAERVMAGTTSASTATRPWPLARWVEVLWAKSRRWSAARAWSLAIDRHVRWCRLEPFICRALRRCRASNHRVSAGPHTPAGIAHRQSSRTRSRRCGPHRPAAAGCVRPADPPSPGRGRCATVRPRGRQSRCRLSHQRARPAEAQLTQLGQTKSAPAAIQPPCLDSLRELKCVPAAPAQ